MSDAELDPLAAPGPVPPVPPAHAGYAPPSGGSPPVDARAP